LGEIGQGETMKKKQVCQMIAALVSICALISLLSTVAAVAAAVSGGSEIPTGMIFLTLVTICCTIMIWRGVREMQE
jgi:predicted Co/Zn/Cd cation transporter (cation efflux family)